MQRENLSVAQEVESIVDCPTSLRISHFSERRAVASKEKDKDEIQRKKIRKYI
jgi:hypothetical protein